VQPLRKRSREVETIGLENLADRLLVSNQVSAGTPAFEFLDWIELLDKREQEALRLRFIEEWEYHEIAAAQEIPIGTVQWREEKACATPETAASCDSPGGLRASIRD